MFQCVGIPFGDGYSMIMVSGLVDRICLKGDCEPSGYCALFIPVKSKQSPHDVCSLCIASFLKFKSYTTDRIGQECP